MSLHPIVIERDASGRLPRWRMYVRDKMTGALQSVIVTETKSLRVQVGHEEAAHVFKTKREVEDAAHMIGRYVLKLGDMTAFHILWRDK